MSFERFDYVIRLLKSIETFSNVNKINVFVVDESISNGLEEQLKIFKWVNYFHFKHIGNARQSNRLLYLLKHFPYKIILNDDIVIQKRGWELFYPQIMRDVNIHHCYFIDQRTQPYTQFKDFYYNNIKFKWNLTSPFYLNIHGSILTFSEKCISSVGYFDEIFNPYGGGHLDYTNRVNLSKIQIPGFFDVSGSEKFFSLPQGKSSIPRNSKKFLRIKNLHNSLLKIYKDDSRRIYQPILPEVEREVTT